MLRRVLSLTAVTVFSVVRPGLAAPQTPAEPPAQPAPAAAPPRVVAGQDGIAIESGDGDFRLQMGGLAQIDGRFVLNDEQEQSMNAFAVRRLRPYLRARLGRHFELFLNPDFAGGTVVLQDAYADMIFSSAFRVRAGKGKTPFGFERLHSASNLLFLERGTPTALAPNRDIGFQVLGDLNGGRVSYLAGVMNGVADGGSSDFETNDGKDVAGRIVLRPFADRPATSGIRGLGLGFAGSRGAATGTAALPVIRTQTSQAVFFSYVTGATPAVADGIRTRYSPSAWYFRGPFGGWTEYIHTELPIRRGEVRQDITHEAWQVAGSWVLTGEAATDTSAGVRPRNNFDFGGGHWGAFQIAARYHALSVDEAAVTLDFAAPGSSRKVNIWTLGLRWYVTGNLSYTVNFERAVFDDDANGLRAAENGLSFRAQLFF